MVDDPRTLDGMSTMRRPQELLAQADDQKGAPHRKHEVCYAIAPLTDQRVDYLSS